MYEPRPIDTSHVTLPQELLRLTERLAENTHELWAQQRLAQGWTYGPARDEGCKKHPDLVPYDQLSEVEKEYDRTTAMEALKVITALGFRIERPQQTPLPFSDAEVADVMQGLLHTTAVSLSALHTLWRGVIRRRGAGAPEVYRLLGERILEVGEPLLAHDVLAVGLAHWPHDVRLRQLHALALARSGATYRANRLLQQLRAEGRAASDLPEETLSILASTHKDLGWHATVPSEREKQLQVAYETYVEAYRLTENYYPGINAATLALVRGDRQEAQRLAHDVRQHALAEMQRLMEQGGDTYWVQATLGEAALLLGAWSEAETWYTEAVTASQGRVADVSATRRQARVIFDYLGRDPHTLDHCFRVPHLVVFAGQMYDPPGRQSVRFQPAQAEATRRAIRTHLEQWDAGIGYAMATCGADLLFLEEMLARGGEIHVVLPVAEAAFRRAAVDILRGPTWGQRFDEVLARAAQVYIVSATNDPEEPIVWRYAQLFMDGLAKLRAQMLHTDLHTLTVWDGKPSASPTDPAFLTTHWRRQHQPAAVIDVTALRPTRRQRTAAVAPTPVPEAVQSPGASQQLRTVLFAESVGYHTLTDPQMPCFHQHVLEPLSKLVATFAAKFPDELLESTIGGNVLSGVFASGAAAGHFALDVRDRLRRIAWDTLGLPPEAGFRIALHTGPVHTWLEPRTERLRHYGTHSNLVTRLEPLALPGHVYATQAFVMLAFAEGVQELAYDYVGRIPLAQGEGHVPMYHVRRWHEPE